jgi:hypothetical protein
MCSETAYYTDMYPNLQMNNINHKLSIYISNISAREANEEYIKKVFHNLNIGDIKQLNFIKNTYNSNYTCYIIMNRWYNNVAVEHLQEKILDEQQVAKIVHDDPMYWILNEYKTIDQNFYDLQQKNLYFEDTINEIKNDINEMKNDISNLKNTGSNTHNANLYTNNSCCGAVSDAWNPMGEPSRHT